MTARKPAKPKPRKRSVPTLEQRVADLEETMNVLVAGRLDALGKRIESLETRAKFRDASHDEPVSNAGEAVGQHFTLIDELPRASWWRRLLTFMRTA